MSDPAELWSAVDAFFDGFLIGPDEALDAAVAASAAAGLPPIQVTPSQGKLLHLLARMIGARQVLEIGTLGGYSTIWLARALPPGGRVVTLEIDPTHARVARESFQRAGLANRIDLLLGDALDSLQSLAVGRPSFDLVFIDADKARIPEYFDWALRFSHPGSVIVVDNVVRKGAVLDDATPDADIQGVRRFVRQIATERRVSASSMQTVGAKGYDGFVIALVVA